MAARPPSPTALAGSDAAASEIKGAFGILVMVSRDGQ
jgi:hypothetical protein